MRYRYVLCLISIYHRYEISSIGIKKDGAISLRLNLYSASVFQFDDFQMRYPVSQCRGAVIVIACPYLAGEVVIALEHRELLPVSKYLIYSVHLSPFLPGFCRPGSACALVVQDVIKYPVKSSACEDASLALDPKASAVAASFAVAVVSFKNPSLSACGHALKGITVYLAEVHR